MNFIGSWLQTLLMNFVGRVTDFVDEFYGQLQTYEFYG